MSQDMQILKNLAQRYAQAAQSDSNSQITKRYRRLNALEPVQPPLLIFEEPWEEFENTVTELQCQCENMQMRQIERMFRRELYKYQHHRGDYALHPYVRSQVAVKSTGIGVQIQEKVRNATTGSSIQGHSYLDVVPDMATLQKLHLPEIALDHEETQRRLHFLEELFDGLLPVKKQGMLLHFNSWDVIPRLHGVENCLCDLYDAPDFAHAFIEFFTRMHEHEMARYEELNILDTDPYYIHCTPACTDALPYKDMDCEKITAKDVWGRAMAQIFAVISPEMHEEFDFVYSKRLLDRCGLAYYGCCEPLHQKIQQLRKFKTLRRISITPWANVEEAAEQMGADYVLSYKPNPAFVAGVWDPEPVVQEIRSVLRACVKNNTPCEFILKDISTVSGDPDNLSRWIAVAQAELEQF